MSFAIIGIIIIIVCWKWGDWRNWKQYYPTILYLMIGDSVTDFLFYNTPLWSYGGLVEKYPVIDISVMMLLYPGTTILYLTYFPQHFGKQILYMLMWVGIYIAAEAIAYFTGSMTYHNGWNFMYSIAFDLIMFPLLRLHYKKPLYVWPISAALAFAFLWWFRIPLSR